jgi:hypothetical protein
LEGCVLRLEVIPLRVVRFGKVSGAAVGRGGKLVLSEGRGAVGLAGNVW